jgi:hypothetical protein
MHDAATGNLPIKLTIQALETVINYLKEITGLKIFV